MTSVLAGATLFSDGTFFPSPMPIQSVFGGPCIRGALEMKRQGDDTYRDYPKRQKNLSGDGYADALANGKFELRLLVGSKAAGAIIGKGGENIKRLRSTGSAGDGGKVEVKMLVHASHAGALIGRGGSKIKELRESTRANIKVFSHCAPLSTDRVVLLAGDETALGEAVKTIIELIRDIPIKGQTKQYDTINYDPSMVPDYGGFSSPMGGSFGGRGMQGPPQGMYGGRGGDRGRGPMGGPPPMGGGGPFAPTHLGPPMGGGFNIPGGPVTTTQVTIPSELGGTIIGRGGERINRIREESGAHIVLEPPSGQEQERIITITGTQTQIHAAQYLLQQCVRTSIAGRKYIGDSSR